MSSVVLECKSFRESTLHNKNVCVHLRKFREKLRKKKGITLNGVGMRF